MRAKMSDADARHEGSEQPEVAGAAGGAPGGEGGGAAGQQQRADAALGAALAQEAVQQVRVCRRGGWSSSYIHGRHGARAGLPFARACVDTLAERASLLIADAVRRLVAIKRHTARWQLGDAFTNPSLAAPQPADTQVEYYFGEHNLPTDAFLLAQIRKGGAERWVKLGVVCRFGKMRALAERGAHPGAVASALREGSALLEVDAAGKHVRRAQPLPEADYCDLYKRTLVAENLPAGGEGGGQDGGQQPRGEYPSVEAVRALFAAHGEVSDVRVVDGRSGYTPKGHLYQSDKIHAVVTMATAEGATAAVASLDQGKSDNWRRREGVRVRTLLAKPWKPWMDPRYVKPAKEKAQKAEEGSAVAEGGAGGGAEGSESEAMDTRDGGSGDDGAKKKKGTKKVRFAAHVPGVHRGPRLPEPGMSFQLGRGRPLAVVLAEVLGVPGAPPTPEARPALRRQTTSCPGETVQAAS